MITTRFVYGTNATFKASGTSATDISDLLVAGKPIYIAFKYLTKSQKDNGLARTWMIQGFNVSSKQMLGETPLPIVNQITSGFRIVDEDPVNAPARSLVSPTRVTLLGNVYKDPNDDSYDPANPIYDKESPAYDRKAIYVPYDPASPYNDPQRENWAVSTPIFTDQVNLGPDWSVMVKGIDTNANGTNYSYTYSPPGTYQVYFVGTNGNIAGSKQIVKTVAVTIEP